MDDVAVPALARCASVAPIEYVYQFNPPQLVFLCQLLADVQSVTGNLVEVGCAHGHSTLFFNRYLDGIRFMRKKYFAIDTFAGFVAEDIQYEVARRHKTAEMYDAFQDNSLDAFEASMRKHAVSRVEAIQCDVNAYDLESLGPLCFALLDVDLYRPIKKALPELYAALSPGGVIVVDDCNPMNFYWDGAYQAYREFMQSQGMTPKVVHGKLGLITKA
ncbi:TylF/MycF/NovP-related O-methyltransferase [Luteibacter pinisoli]|nr:TylF/MycF/NovP-related O-methyltransferase [Luteibacter pinisoli]